MSRRATLDDMCKFFFFDSLVSHKLLKLSTDLILMI